jgi:hypothetical protein
VSADVVSRSRIQELIRRARAARNEAAVALADEAIQSADLLRDEPLAYEARMAMIEVGTFGGYPERALVAFAWCRAYAKAHPGQVDRSDLVWRYKWIIQNLPGFVSVPRARIEEALADFTEEAAPWGPRSARALRLANALEMGDRDGLRELLDVWRDTPRDRMSDCPSCERASEVTAWIELGQNRKAVLRAAPLVEGRMTCRVSPHNTYSRLLIPLLRLGETELAATYHERGYAMIRRDRGLLESAVRHLDYLVRIDNLSKAVTLFERHLPWALDFRDDSSRFRFSAASLSLFDKLARERPGPLRLRLPRAAQGFREDGSYDPAVLRDLLRATAEDLAARFDARNGNSEFTRKLRRALAPLPKARKARKVAP